MLRVLDLFSGIGGFSLGLERTGGFETAAFCEIEPFCQKVLNKHWPGVPVYSDVRMLRGYTFPDVDVITGGFPCQDISIAGKQRGLESERSGLWSHIARLIGEIRPKYAIVENVANLLSGPSERPGDWFGTVLGDLAALGYDAEWHCIQAAHVGRPILRERVWIIAQPSGLQRIYQPNIRQGIRGGMLNDYFTWPAGPWTSPKTAVCRVVDGIPDRVDRSAALGNAVVPQIPEIIGNAILQAEAAN